MLVAKAITKKYGDIEILKGVDMQVREGEVVSLVGASGAGKSTLLHILGSLDRADSGEVLLQGKKISQLQGNALAKFRNQNIGFIFQFHHLLPEFTAVENICIPAWVAGKKKNETKKEAMRLLQLLHLEHRAQNKPTTLSGGERQRVAVARALINKPKIIFADEPSGNLDSHNAKELHQLFFQLRKEMGQTFLIATHNQELAAMSDRALFITDGILSEEKNKCERH